MSLPFSLVWLGNPWTSDYITGLLHPATTFSGIEQSAGFPEKLGFFSRNTVVVKGKQVDS